ncbi:Protein of unknown function [Chitinophaga rupis]|uniref:Hypervirulence associated protein TUDOR domain-containing protein n=1 Tax=Chitinophaga rupis TaxID=573321 RepID=A0A1H8IY40_9BACT|nr:DUF2945 domain-containing protein [Chitinophaga rupis]SEN73524.1 Protein of unknown function [Chitinophaga rupis]
MEKQFKKGNTVHWKSSTGKIIKVHTKDFTFKGVTHRASASEPQYEVESDKSGGTAAHKASALHK